MDELELFSLLKEKERRLKYNKLDSIFPESGPFRRELYPKHLAFMAAGATFRERLFSGGNRTGKSSTGLTELTKHATGKYGSWWAGKTFDRPVTIWLCGDRGEIIRDSLQKHLLGTHEIGTGLIPKEDIVELKAMPGVSGGIGQYVIKHYTNGVYDGNSIIVVKTYQAGKDAYEGATVDVVMLDEECPFDIYVECQMRTMTTNGTVYCTFTPDSGLTETVLHFMQKPKPGEQEKFVTMVGWDDVPHLDDMTKKSMLATIPPHLRAVKTRGVPYLGRGAIYPVPENDIVVSPMPIPDYWPRVFGLDVGWQKTAVVWIAFDPDNGVYYIYGEYKKAEEQPPMHAEAIKARGAWIEGCIDKAARRRNEEGERLIDKYYELGVTIHPSLYSKQVESGINKVLELLSTGRLKIFNTCQEWLYEYRIYRRGEDGRIADKQEDHLMDAMRYAIDMFHEISRRKPYDIEHWDTKVAHDFRPKSVVGGY